MLSDAYLDILVCPKSKQPLIYFPRGEDDRDEADGFLFCPASRLRYPIRDGVPVMLVDEATPVEAPRADELLTRARQLRLRLTGQASPDGGSRSA